MGLKEYKAKRDFRVTSEPPPRVTKTHKKPIFVVQEHHARRLHYDFRLEADGVLKSWAVPKQPTLDPAQRRLAVQVEDHPLEYGKFKGTIPEGQYGAGEVFIWDNGTYENLAEHKPRPETVTEAIEHGRVEVRLHGKKLKGDFTLVRMTGRNGGKENWLLIKKRDEFADPEASAEPAQTGKASRRQWVSNRPPRASGDSTAPAPALSNPEKILFPEPAITKAEVFDFYKRMAPRLLPFLRDRPVTLERAPEGVNGNGRPHFWQKNVPSYYPSWIPRAELRSKEGRKTRYALVNDIDTLLYLVNQGTITFHVWMSRIHDLAWPDFVLFDLDPGDGRFSDVVAAAKKLHEILNREGVDNYLKTSGKRGLHVLTPWKGQGGYNEARAWAWEIGEQLVKSMPDRTTLQRLKARRGSRVYIDVMQNALGLHVVPPYVLRVIPSASVSTPLEWKELTASLDPADFNLRTLPGKLARRKKDPLAPLARAWK